MSMVAALMDFLTGKTAERLRTLEAQAAEASARMAEANLQFAKQQNEHLYKPTDFSPYLPASRETIAKGLYQCQQAGTDATQHLSVANYLFTLKYDHRTQTFTLTDKPWYHIEKRDGKWNDCTVQGDISGDRVIIDEVNRAVGELMQMIRGDIRQSKQEEAAE